MKYEFITLEDVEEAKWLRNFLEDIPCWENPAVPPIRIHCDNMPTIGRAQSSMYYGKSRHIHRDIIP